jgi:hypothetical protein
MFNKVHVYVTTTVNEFAAEVQSRAGRALGF